MQTILFLCTGNYFRSRFAEQLFNHIAQAEALPWVAESRALRPVALSRNPGSISVYKTRRPERRSAKMLLADRKIIFSIWYPRLASDCGSASMRARWEEARPWNCARPCLRM